jgi:hypothetical protein
MNLPDSLKNEIALLLRECEVMHQKAEQLKYELNGLVGEIRDNGQEIGDKILAWARANGYPQASMLIEGLIIYDIYYKLETNLGTGRHDLKRVGKVLTPRIEVPE